MADTRSNNNYTTSVDPILPSRITRLIDDFTARVELKAARVAAGNAPADELEKQFRAILLASEDEFPERAPTLKQNMARPLNLFRSSQRYATFASVDPAEPGALEHIDLVAKHGPGVSTFATQWVHIPPMVDGLVNLDKHRDLVPQAGFTGLKFYVSKVKCVEETDGLGSDEIYLGGNFVDETGDSSYYWFRVSNDFDTGEVVDYGHPGRLLQQFNLTEGGAKFPKIYTATMSMVEEDWGNMSSWFKDLHEKLKMGIYELLKKLGYALGQLIGLGDIGALIGSILGKITNWLMDWIVNLFANDYMGSFITQATINSYSGSWVTTDPYASWSRKFKAHGGHYHVWYAWQLVK